MEVPDFTSDFPITLANWHSASSLGTPVSTLRNLTLFEHDYIDNGGSGIYVHREDEFTFKTYQLKCDSMGTAPYYPKCFTLPLNSSPVNTNRFDQLNDGRPTLNRNHCNSLFYSNRLESFFSVDLSSNRLNLYRLEKDDNSPALSKLDLLSSSSNLCELPSEMGPVCEISPSHYDPQSDVAFFVRQSKAISLLQLEEQDSQLILTSQPLTFQCSDKRENSLVNEFDDYTEFWKCSKSHILQHNLALGQYGKDANVTLSDYNFETQQFVWICSSAKTDYKRNLSWESPCGLYWIRDHPKLLAYCEINQFALLDTRSKNTMLSIMDRHNLFFARDWEKFRESCQLSISDTQFLISLDHKVILVDRRYPQKNLLTWNHMLPSNINNLPHFLSSTTINNSNQSIILLANNKQSCLMTVEPFELTNIIQPKSLHIPLHLSQPTDCWYYSSNAVDDVRNHLEKCSLTGLIVVPAENGFSVVQSTNDNRLYVQDFFPSTEIDPEYRVSWNKSCLPNNLVIPDEIESILENTFERILSKDTIEANDIDLEKAELQKDEDPIPVPPAIIKPKLLMPLPGLSNGDDMQSASEEEELTQFAEELISKRMNLLYDDIESINENEFTIKLLSKWRDDINTNGNQ